MGFKGSPEIEEFFSLLETESPRGLVIVVQAYFDEKLALLLRRGRDHFYTRINLGLAARILTQNEHDDLHVIRNLRNSFAHNLRANTFDTDKSQQIDALKTWQIAVGAFPEYAELWPNAKERLLYVAGAFHLRLKDGQRQNSEPLPEPPIYDPNCWPIISDR